MKNIDRKGKKNFLNGSMVSRKYKIREYTQIPNEYTNGLNHSVKTDKVKFEIKHMLGAKGDATY